MQSNADNDGPRLPPKPEPPDPAECCGSGCDPCILELYDDELDRWEARVERIRAQWREQQGQGDRG